MSGIGNNDGGAVAGSFTLNTQMPNGQTMTFSGYVLQGESVAEINEKMDVAMMVVSRQRTFAELPELEAKLDGIEKHKGHLIEQLEGWSREPPPTASNKKAQQQLNIQNAQQQIKMHDKEIAAGRARIAEIRAQMAGPKAGPKLVA